MGRTNISAAAGNLERALTALRLPLMMESTLAKLTTPHWLATLQLGALAGPAAQRFADRLAVPPPAFECELEIIGPAHDREAPAAEHSRDRPDCQLTVPPNPPPSDPRAMLKAALEQLGPQPPDTPLGVLSRGLRLYGEAAGALTLDQVFGLPKHDRAMRRTREDELLRRLHREQFPSLGCRAAAKAIYAKVAAARRRRDSLPCDGTGADIVAELAASRCPLSTESIRKKLGK